MEIFLDQVQDQHLELQTSILLKKFIIDDRDLHKRLPSVLKALNGKDASEKELSEKVSRLSFNWEAFQKLSEGKTVSIKELLEGDEEIISVLNAVNLGIGSKNITPYPWFLRLQNVLIKTLKENK